MKLNKIKLWCNSLFKYKLSKKEREVYNSILNKDAMGYGEWYAKTHGDDICGHWIKDITIEEIKLLDKIHKHFYGEDWWKDNKKEEDRQIGITRQNSKFGNYNQTNEENIENVSNKTKKTDSTKLQKGF